MVHVASHMKARAVAALARTAIVSSCLPNPRLLTCYQSDKTHVVLCGMGPVVTKTISCAELVKRRILVCRYLNLMFSFLTMNAGRGFIKTRKSSW